ncbi:MAG: TMEM175 family protein, partial [Ferruginibacter sp.]
MIRKHVFKDKAKNDSVRWRLHEPARVEAFSDAVFAFALTLVVISLEVPQTFHELLHMMKGFFGFALCFLFIMLIWHDQYLFFRRYGLQDTRTIFYNMVLLFMVIYLVYPLKFLFYSFTAGFQSTVVEHGVTLARFNNEGETCQLMIIYGIGYFTIYSLFGLMHIHALKRRKDILLTPLEIYNTKTHFYTFTGSLGVVMFSLAIAIVGLSHSGPYAFFSGISYSLIGLVMWIVGGRRGKRIKQLFSHQEIEEIKNEIVVLEEK